MNFSEVKSKTLDPESKDAGIKPDFDKMISPAAKETSRGEAADRSYDPDKLVDMSGREALYEGAKDVFDPDKLKEIGSNFREGVGNAVHEIENVFDTHDTDYLDRIKHTPGDLSKRVEFVDKRGESVAMPRLDTSEGRELDATLNQLGVKGIVYRRGYPDFSPVAIETVKIKGMSENRHNTKEKQGNYEKAETKLAEQWNKSGRDGKTDWTARDVKNYREEGNLTWHEKEDLKTMQLVPTAVHEAFRHSGGVAEFKNKHGLSD